MLVLAAGGFYLRQRIQRAQQAGNALILVTPRDALVPVPPVPPGAEIPETCTVVAAHDRPVDAAVDAQLKNTDPMLAGWTSERYRDEAGKLWLNLRGLPQKIAVSRLYAHLFKAM